MIRAQPSAAVRGCFFPNPSRRIYGIFWFDMWVCGTPKRKHFRTMNVQWIGKWTFLAVVAVPGINNSRAVNTPDSSTPVAFTSIYSFINSLQAFA
jgi:hypothetical protein